jgi:hypothetical protein
MGCYTPEEMGECIDVTPNGTTTVLSPAAIVKSETAKPVVESEPTPAPVPTPAPAPSSTTASNGNTVGYNKRTEEKLSELCTEAQVKMLHAVGKQNGYDHEALKEIAWLDHGREHLEELTKAEVQLVKKFIEGNAK